jgi:hypothetical protein
MKTAALGLIAALVILIIIVLAVIATVFFGYAVGLLIVAMPFLSGTMVGGTSINPADIPTYTAWIAVAAVMFSLSNIKLTIGSSKPAMVPVKEIEFKTK